MQRPQSAEEEPGVWFVGNSHVFEPLEEGTIMQANHAGDEGHAVEGHFTNC